MISRLLLRSSRSWRLLSLAILSVACGDSVSSAPVDGTYLLSTLNGQALPYDHELGCWIYLAGRLTFTAPSYQIVISAQNKNNQQVFDVAGTGTYSQQGSRLTFQQTAGDIAFHLFDSRVSGSEISVALGGDGPGAADQFHARFVE